MAKNILRLFLVLTISAGTLYTVFAQTAGEGWVRIGLLAGNISLSGGNAIGISPSYDSDTTLYVGIAGNGLWRSSNRGATWQHILSTSSNPTIPNNATVTAIAFDPGYKYGSGNGRAMYVGTQDGYVYASFDDFASVGSSYTRQFLNGQTPLAVTGLAVPPNGSWPGWLFAAVQGSGVYYNYAYGLGSAYNLGSPASMNAVACLAVGSQGEVLAGAQFVDGGPVFQQTALGSWTNLGPSTLVNQAPASLASRKDGSGRMNVFLGTATHGMWRYHFNTGTGVMAWDPGCDGTSGTATVPYSIFSVGACPNFASDNEVWEGRGIGLSTSTDGGATCTANTPASPVTAIAFAPGYDLGGYCDAFVGTTAGLFLKTCTPSVPPPSRLPAPVPNVTPSAVSVSALAVARGGPKGTWGAGSLGLLRCTQNDPITGRPLFLQYNASGVSSAPNIVAICMTPGYSGGGTCGTDAATLFVAEHAQGVFESTDNGNSWTQLSLNWPGSTTVNDLAISPRFSSTGDTTLFAATSNGLYRWDAGTTGWVRASSDMVYSVSHVYVPQTYDRSQSVVNPYHTVFFSVDDSRYPGFFASLDDGTHFTRMLDSNNYVGAVTDITSIVCSPRYGLGGYDTQIFVSRATTGVFYTTNLPGNSPYYFCRIDTGLVSTFVRDLAVMPVYLSSGDTKLLAATDSGVAWCDFYRGNVSGSSCDPIYTWTNAGLAPPSGCTDTRSLAYAYLYNGKVAAAGTAEDGILFSTDYGSTFSLPGLGYRSLPDDVWTTVAYARNTTYLFATSPTYGVFISRDQGASFQPYNGPGCTPLNDGAMGFGNGFDRWTGAYNPTGWNIDTIYAGTHCNGAYYRPLLGDYGGTPYYFYYMDSYGWSASTENNGAFGGPVQKIVNFSNGNSSETIWASSTSSGSCGTPGQGELACSPGSVTDFAQQNTGLPSNNATSAKNGMDTSANPTPLSNGVTVAGSVAQGGWVNYYFVVPSGSAHLNVSLILDSPSYDDDVYIRYASPPTSGLWDYRPYYGAGSNEIVDILPTSSPAPLTGGFWYISVNGYSSGTTTYHLTASLLSSVAAVSEDAPSAVTKPEGSHPPARSDQAEYRPGPLAPSAGTVWGTVGESGVYKGTQTSSFAPVPEIITWSWEARNGLAPTNLDTGHATQTAIQLTDGTVLAGQAGALWQSPAPDEGRTTWYNTQTDLGGLGLPSNPDVRDFLWISNGDVLIALNGAAGTGGVWLSGDVGVDWMNISSGFDASSQKLESLVVDDPSKTPPFYYAGTDSTGAYARTITPKPYPTATSLSSSSGPAAGGTVLTVTGTNFLSSCPTGNPSDSPFTSPVVVFGTDYVAATYLSATSLRVTTPPHGTGTVPIKVINPDTRMATCACTFSFTGDTGLNFTVTRSGGNTLLNWGTDTQLTVQRATNPQFSTGARSWSVHGSGWTDTTNASSDGTLYFYRIQ